jgi:hypothetical protein
MRPTCAQETHLLIVHNGKIADPLQALAPEVGRAVLAVQREGSGSVVYHLHSTLHLSHIGMLLIACAMAALPQPVRVYPAANVVEFWQKCATPCINGRDGRSFSSENSKSSR